MKDFEKHVISDGINYICVPATRFKTNESSVSFALPMDEKTASRNALLIRLLSSCSKDYPDMMTRNKKLAMLYGASLRSSAVKQGDTQVLSLMFSALDDRFSIDGEKISLEGLKLLFSLAFNPRLDENGDFYDDDIEREKRILIQKLESENNDKRSYALKRLEEEMFRGEAFSCNVWGEKERVKNITKAELKEAYGDFLEKAKIQLVTVGDADEEKSLELFKTSLPEVKRNYEKIKKAKFIPSAKESKTVEERQEIKQGKLVLGFRVNARDGSDKTDAVRVFTDIFGGGPYSKLFMNVREKLSLCYYCSARYYRRNNCIIIQCGCEEENMDKAVNEILRQNENIQNGDFESEYNSSIIALCDSVKSVYDDSLVLLSWYMSQICDDEILSPSRVIEDYKNVTFDEVKNASSLLSLDTVFKLMSQKEEK